MFFGWRRRRRGLLSAGGFCVQEAVGQCGRDEGLHSVNRVGDFGLPARHFRPFSCCSAPASFDAHLLPARPDYLPAEAPDGENCAGRCSACSSTGPMRWPAWSCLLSMGAMGKSAQFLPAHHALTGREWKARTPVSALIHAATMVTAAAVPGWPHVSSVRTLRPTRLCWSSPGRPPFTAFFRRHRRPVCRTNIKRVIAYSTCFAASATCS